MLDGSYFQDKVEELEKALKRRHLAQDFIAQLTGLARSRRELIQQTETLKALRNKASQEIAQLKGKAKTDPAAAATAELRVAEMRAVGDQIKKLDDELKTVE